MTVVHISTVHPTYDQRIFYKECITLRRAGYNVILLIHSDNKDIIRNDVRIQSLGTRTSNKLRIRLLNRLYRIGKALKIALNLRAYIYHVHDPELLIIVPFLKLFTQSKVIYDCHEDNVSYMLQKQYIPKYIRIILALSIKYIERLSVFFLDAVITADPGVQKKFNKTGAKTEVLYNFPRLELFDPASQIGDKDYDLVYHGSIPSYHMEICLNIDNELKRKGRFLRWLFLGHYDNKNLLQEMIDANNATQRFALLDSIPHDKVSSEVKKGHIGIIPLPDLPKFQHNIPTKLFEFMALEMPVIMSNLPPSRPFMNGNNFAIMVPPHDYTAYADAIISLLDNPSLRISMGKSGRLKIESDYNWDRESKKLMNLYSSLI